MPPGLATPPLDDDVDGILPEVGHAEPELTDDAMPLGRDAAQAAFRLRRLGRGQRVRLFLIPEVAGCV